MNGIGEKDESRGKRRSNINCPVSIDIAAIKLNTSWKVIHKIKTASSVLIFVNKNVSIPTF